MTVRIYGKTLNQWTAVDERGREVLTQVELAYKEYDSRTCELVRAGSEDIPMGNNPAARNRYALAEVRTWDGRRLNKGGYRWWEYQGIVRYRPSDRKALREYIEHKYPSAALVELRPY